MIQRAQSLYLLIIATLAFFLVFLNPSYAVFKNEESQKTARLGYTTTVVADNSGEQSVGKWINAIMLAFMVAVATLAIFLFKKRELQKKLCIYLCLIAALLAIFMVLDYNTMKAQFPGTSTYPGVWSIFPVLIVIMGFMAWRGIRKDEALVKSMDRIR